jgi:NapC/NirT cytochrome c family, N-terminal region
MISDSSEVKQASRSSCFRNWISLTGSIVAIGSLFAFIFLVAIDSMSHDGNPYLGILTYIVAPTFLILGLLLIFTGWWLQRRQARQFPMDVGPLSLSIDLARPRDRKVLIIFGSCSVVFLLLTAFGSYQTYHFTESVEFCGKTCHVVMKPEYVTYHRSSHARVSCAECHIGSGASWYVKSKISGAYQVYSVIFGKYSRPIPTPVTSLRPAQDTCEKCHWPEKFTGNLDRSYEHFLSDKKNTPTTVRLLLRARVPLAVFIGT